MEVTTLEDYYEIAPGGDVTLVLHKALTPPAPDAGETDGLADEQIREIRVRVFSQHLILASPVFMAMLQGSFGEGQTLRADGRVTIPLPEDDPNAMILILNVIHHRDRSVPTSISRKLMAQVLVLVDKYQFSECLHFASKTWVQNLNRTELPYSFSSELMEWIYIAWVHNLETTFRASTRTAILTATHVIKERDVMGLSIPSSVLERMNAQREERIQSMYDKFYRFLNRYKGTQHSYDSQLKGAPAPREQACCRLKSAACDFYYLGRLLRLAMKQNAHPRPLPPYDKHSLSSIKFSFRIQHRGIKLPKHIHLKCGEETEQLLQSKLSWGEVGLSLVDFKREQRGRHRATDSIGPLEKLAGNAREPRRLMISFGRMTQ